MEQKNDLPGWVQTILFGFLNFILTGCYAAAAATAAYAVLRVQTWLNIPFYVAPCLLLAAVAVISTVEQIEEENGGE